MEKKVLVVAAHIGDFVWRCGGTIAKYVQGGAQVHLIVLTYGIRGEMNAYWKREGAAAEEAKALRRAEGMAAAEILGISRTDILDYEDYPMELTTRRIEDLAAMIREFAPDVILTHDSERDPYNADHTLTGEKIYEAISIAAARGVKLRGLPAVSRPQVFGFEPHVAEASGFKPRIYIDFTDVHEIKENAMKAYQSQSGMYAMYINRAKIRAQQSHCGMYAEAFSMKQPITGLEFPVD